MSTVLDELVRAARQRAQSLPDLAPLGAARPCFRSAIAGKERISVIAEFKRRSPSEDEIADRDLLARVCEYEEAGAAACSVLTEPTRFGGSFSDLRRAAAATALPVLMKDFVVTPEQVVLAAALGASACLLIVRCLDGTQLPELAATCSEHGLAPLVECHAQGELDRALAIDGAVIGVNNRDLDDLSVDCRRAAAMLQDVPPERITVAESGYDDPSQLAALHGLADAVLVGTTLMRADDPGRFIAAAAGGVR